MTGFFVPVAYNKAFHFVQSYKLKNVLHSFGLLNRYI